MQALILSHMIRSSSDDYYYETFWEICGYLSCLLRVILAFTVGNCLPNLELEFSAQGTKHQVFRGAWGMTNAIMHNTETGNEGVLVRRRGCQRGHPK